MNDVKKFLLNLSKYNALLDFGINLSCSKPIPKKGTMDLFVYPFCKAEPNAFHGFEDSIRTASARYYKQFYSIVERMNILSENPVFSKKIFKDPNLENQFICYIRYLLKQNYINYTPDTIKVSNTIPFSSCAVLGTIIKITYKKYDELDIISFRDSFINELKYVLFTEKIINNQSTTFFLYHASIIEMSVFFHEPNFNNEYKLNQLLTKTSHT